MKTLLALLFSLVAAAVALPQGAPPLMSYQGRLTDEGGVPPVNGVYRLAFRLLTNAIPVNGEPVIWGREYDVSVVAGEFNVILGAPGGTPVAEATVVGDLASAFRDPARFLELRIVRAADGTIVDRTILPRQQLLSVPYVFHAEKAKSAVSADSVLDSSIVTDSLQDGAVSTTKLKDGGVTAEKMGDASVFGSIIAREGVNFLSLAAGLRPIRPSDVPQTVVSPRVSESDSHQKFIKVCSVEGPGRLTGISLKSQVFNSAGAFLSLRITIDGVTYLLPEIPTGRVAQHWHIVWINPLWTNSDPPNLPKSYFEKEGGLGSGFDLDLWFNSRLEVELRGDHSDDGRSGFTVATSFFK